MDKVPPVDNNTGEFRKNIINAMNSVLEALSRYDEESVEIYLAFAMGKIAEAVDVDYLAMSRHPQPDAEQRLLEIFDWNSGRRSFTEETKNYLRSFIFYDDWNSRLRESVCLTLNINEVNEEEREFMMQYGVKSVLIVPVVINTKILGELIFVDNECERSYDDEIKGLLRSVSMLLVNAYLRTQTEHKLMEESFFNRKFVGDLKRREKMLSALNQTALAFLFQHERVHGGQLYKGMEIIAGYAYVDRVCVWKRELIYFEPRYTLYRKWSNAFDVYPGALSEGGIFPFEAFNRWDNIFNNNGYMHCLVSELDERKKKIMKKYGVSTLLLFPVFSRDGLWGLVSFDKCDKEYLFNSDEVDTLHYASLMLGSVIVRDEESAKAREAESRNRLMLDAMPLSCQLWDRNYRLVDCNEAALKLFELSTKEELFEKLPLLAPKSQPDGSNSMKLGMENLVKAFAEGGTVFEWLFQLPDGTLLPTEVTLKRVEYKGGYIVAGYTRDLRRIKLLESEAGKIYFDPLTGIYNRRYLDETLFRIMKTLSRSNGMLSFMIIDIDRFKEYNDAYGHWEGDACLRMVADTLKAGVTRSDDFVARYGGEEFAVVLPNTDEHGARMIAERLVKSILECKRFHSGSDVGKFVSVSIGVTSCRVTPLHNEQDLINSADNMLYRAKREGRNRYCFQVIG